MSGQTEGAPPFSGLEDSLAAEYLAGRFQVEALVTLGGREVDEAVLREWAWAEALARCVVLAAPLAERSVAGELAVQLGRVARRAGRLAEVLGLGEDVVRGFVAELRA